MRLANGKGVSFDGRGKRYPFPYPTRSDVTRNFTGRKQRQTEKYSPGAIRKFVRGCSMEVFRGCRFLSGGNLHFSTAHSSFFPMLPSDCPGGTTRVFCRYVHGGRSHCFPSYRVPHRFLPVFSLAVSTGRFHVRMEKVRAVIRSICVCFSVR